MTIFSVSVYWFFGWNFVFLRFWENFVFFRFWQNFIFLTRSFFGGQRFFIFFLPKLVFGWQTFIWQTSFVETSLGKLHLGKLHFVNFIWHWLATPIHSLAVPGSTQAKPVALIVSNGWTDRQTHAQLYNYIIDQCIIIDKH